ncbi:MAG: hypothetical protein Q8Q04_01810 [archaeon]|nr:hypothetical protein [archaeon]
MKKIMLKLMMLGVLASPLSYFLNPQEKNEKKETLNEEFLKDKISYEGGLEIKLLDKDSTIEIPTWRDLHVKKPSMCAQYARKLTLQFGYQLENPEDSWDLHKVNPSIDFSREKLIPWNLVTFYNKYSQYNRKNRIATHTAVYLGKDHDGKLYFAEQRGSSTRISTEKEMEKDGIYPRKIIKTEKIN